MKPANPEKRRRRKQKVGGWTSGGCLLRFHLMVFLVLTLWSNAVSSIDLTRLLQHRTLKRTGGSLITSFSTGLLKSTATLLHPLTLLICNSRLKLAIS